MIALRNILIIIIISFQCLYSQTIINNVTINPLNRANIYLSSLPETYLSRLSPDKRKVIITIKNTKVPESERKHHGTGVIQDIYMQSLGKDVEINLILGEPRGYTAVLLPYSKAMIIDVFDWNRLTPAEEHYRTGLLGLENKIESAMQKELVKASSLGNADAAAFLALNELSKGNIFNAIDNLKISAQKTSIPDIYAAISHLYNLANAKIKSQMYQTYFKKLTGLNNYDNIILNYTDELNKFTAAPNIYIEKLDEIVINDSLFMFPDSIHKSDSSGLSRFKNLFPDDNKQKNNIANNQSGQKSILPDWFGLAAFITIGLIIISGFIIGIAYIKWRNKKIESLKTVGRTKSETSGSQTSDDSIDAKNVGSALRNKAISAYSSKPPSIINEQENQINKRIITSEEQKEKLHQVLSRMSEDEEKNDTKSKSGSIVDNINLDDNDTESKHFNTSQNFISPSGTSVEQIEFAKTLHKEFQKIKEKNLEAVNKNEINIDDSQVTDVAKQLGIEQENINIKKIMDDEENPSIQALKEKLKGRV